MNINIETNTTQQLTTAEVDLLAKHLCGVKLTLADSGVPTYNILSVTQQQGGLNASCSTVYKDAVDALALKGINVSYTTQYMRILDPEVRRLLSAFFNGQEGLPINPTDVVNSTNTSFQTLFKNNKNIVNFDEFKYFSWYNTNGYWSFEGCSNLQSIDISNVSVFPYACFRYCNSLCYFNGSNSERGRLTLGSCSLPARCFEACNGIESVEFLNSDISFQNTVIQFGSCLNISKIYVKDINDYLNIPFTEASSNPLSTHGGVLYANGQVVTSVVYPETQTSVRNGQWVKNTALQSVVLPNSITTIGASAFQSCTGLTSINIPSGVTSIGNGAFAGCSNLIISDLNLPNLTSLGSNAFQSTKVQQVSDLGNLTSVPWLAFDACGSLLSVSLSNNITLIGSFAFRSCGNLVIQDLSLPNLTSLGTNTFQSTKLQQVSDLGNVTSIPHYCFHGCNALTSIVLPNTVTSIGASAFQSCTALTTINIPSGVTSIGNSAFNGCNNLVISDLNLPNLTSLGNGAFSSTKVQQVSDLGSITSIPLQCFLYCTALTAITIPNSVTSIRGSAFSGCTSLTSVTIPDSVTSIGGYAFNGCTSLTSINIPEGVTKIDGYTFKNCVSLTSITIPASVTSLANEAFQSCSGLTAITVNATIPPTWNGVPIGGTSCPIYVPAESINAYKTASGWSTYASRIYPIAIYYTASAKLTEVTGSAGGLHTDAFNTTISSHTFDNGEGVIIFDGVLTSIGQNAFASCTALTTINIPNTVTSIGAGAFYGCGSLTSINIPNGVTSIGQNAFQNCTALTSVTLPNTLTSLGKNAFCNCPALTTIDIPSGVTSIENNAFQNCTALTSVTLPNTLTSVGNNAFRNTKLTSIVIPNSVTTLRDDCFSQCPNLTSITIGTGLTALGRNIFSYCQSLETLVIPPNVKSLEKDTLQHGTSLQWVRLESTTMVSLYNASCFLNTNNCIIYVPSDLVDSYKADSTWSSLASRIQAIPTT